MLSKLQLNWQSLMREFEVESHAAQQVFLDLVNFYSNSERFYHNLEHIYQVLEIIESWRSHSQNLTTVRFAAWFHDVIYDSKAKDNEEKSAEYAELVLNRLAIPKQIISSTKELILKTKAHQSLENDIESQILLDADMAILGVDECKYKKYAQAIRQEYSWLSIEDYRIGRANFLKQILQRKRIYLTEKMFAELEKKARANIKSEIETLD